VPQPPQLFGSLAVLAQVEPLQQVSPFGQLAPPPQPPTHVPAEQVWPVAQAWPHLPQLSGSVEVSTSQPSPTAPLQSANPGAQAPMAHWENVHAAVALGSGPQGMPQPPQFAGSLVGSTQRGAQQSNPGEQAWPWSQRPTQWSPTQASPLGHWSLLVHCTHMCVSSRQCGVAGVLLQSASVTQPLCGAPPVPPAPPVPEAL
jgi:hypothetical protein